MGVRPLHYDIIEVLVAEDEYKGEDRIIHPAPIYKPHETANGPFYWVVSNERSGKAGITIFENETNRVLATLNIEHACIPVVQPDGTLGECAPPSKEGARHPHGIAIDDRRGILYQVIEHSGLQWTPDRKSFMRATSTDTESGLLVLYDISDPLSPKLLYGYVLGHAAEEVAVNLNNGKAYVGNHEPSPTNVPCFLSVIVDGSDNPYRFIDLPPTDCVQGVGVDQYLNTVNGTTHFGQKMYTFDSITDTILYSVDIRGPFNAYIASLPPSQQFKIPKGWILHMHDLATDSIHHVAYQTIHTIATPIEVEEADDDDESTTTAETSETASTGPEEITGRWVAAVNTDPASPDFKKVTIIDLSNGQSVPAVRTHEDAIATGLPYNKLFVHAHFVAVDPYRGSLLVTGEHTGNLGVVYTKNDKLKQVIAITRRIPGCHTKVESEPHVHGVSISEEGTAYVSDEGEPCLYESVTILKPHGFAF